MEADLEFDFESTLEAQQPFAANEAGAGGSVNIGPGGRAEPKPRNYRQTVCTYWLRGLCMKGDTCGFLHQFDPNKMPVCRNLLKFGVCKEPDCPYKHTTEEIKECNMYKLGFCIYGPACRFKHTRQEGPPPEPDYWEAAKPREFRNISIVANQANEGILPADIRRRALRLGPGDQQAPALPAPPGSHNQQLAVAQDGAYGSARPPAGQHGRGGGGQHPSFVDQSLLAAVGQRDLRYGF